MSLLIRSNTNEESTNESPVPWLPVSWNRSSSFFLAPVPITLSKTASDPSFDAFRKELAEIAQKRDRAALAERVAANFFWIPETTDLADKQRPPIENVAKALSLDGPDGVG